MPVKKKASKKLPPPVRGRRGHSSIDQQAGLAELLDKWLLEQPKPTFDDMLERLKATGFWVSRSALARYGLKFEMQRRDMKLLLAKARLLAQDDPESVLDLERAIANLANVKLFENLLDPDANKITEDAREVMKVAARIASSSSSRERARLAYSRGIKAATAIVKAELEQKFKSNPEALRVVLRALEEVSKTTEEKAKR